MLLGMLIVMELVNAVTSYWALSMPDDTRPTVSSVCRLTWATPGCSLRETRPLALKIVARALVYPMINGVYTQHFAAFHLRLRWRSQTGQVSEVSRNMALKLSFVVIPW